MKQRFDPPYRSEGDDQQGDEDLQNDAPAEDGDPDGERDLTLRGRLDHLGQGRHQACPGTGLRFLRDRQRKRVLLGPNVLRGVLERE